MIPFRDYFKLLNYPKVFLVQWVSRAEKGQQAEVEKLNRGMTVWD